MKILVLNCGSSSIKYKLFDMTSGNVMAQGGIEKIGLPGAFLKLTDKDGKKVILEKDIPGHQEGIEFILGVLTDATYGCIKDYKEIKTLKPTVLWITGFSFKRSEAEWSRIKTAHQVSDLRTDSRQGEPFLTKEEAHLPDHSFHSFWNEAPEPHSPRPAPGQSHHRPDFGNGHTHSGNEEAHHPPHRYDAWQ